MRSIFGSGPAPARPIAALSHRFALLSYWTVVTCLSCNVGHEAPTPAPELADDSKDDTTNDDNDPSDDTTSEPDTTTEPGDAAVDGATGTTAAPCNDDAYRCIDVGQPERERCEAGKWVAGEPCGNGLVCEIANGTSTTCVAATNECDGGACGEPCSVGTIDCRYVDGTPDVAVSCPSGSKVQNTCNDDTPHCVSEEGCKQCSRAAHCTREPPACQEYTCNDDFECELVPLDEGQACTGGVCSATAQCVVCNQPEDCGTPDVCHHFACNANACEVEFDTERSYCESDTGTLCNAAGACVACLMTNDCPSTDVPECYRAVCTPEGACATEPQDANTPCGLTSDNVCDGAGTCVECVSLTNCDDAEVCHEHTCQTAYASLGWYEEQTGASSILFPDFVYVRRVTPLPYPANLDSFGAIAHVETNEAMDIALYADNGEGTGPQGPPLTVLRLEGLAEGYRAVAAEQHPSLDPGTYYWLGFRVSNQIELRYGSGTELSYETGAIIPRERGDFGNDFYTATGEDFEFGIDTEPFAVFAIARFIE